MEHVVFFPGPDAAPSFQRFASLEEAVGFVEHLRNVEGVAEVSVHALTTVPVAFRAYYKVEVPVAEMPAAEVMAEVPAQAAEPVAEVDPHEADESAAVAAELTELTDPVDVPGLADDGEPVLVAAVDGEASSNGKRSLGFFSH